VDIYGVTLSVGFRGDKAGINLGVEAERGAGHDLIIEDISSGYQDTPRVRVRREHTRVIFFLAGAFDFAKAEAIEVFEDDLEAR
jgi:hypothetical protein